jgi:hypothetical protein
MVLRRCNWRALYLSRCGTGCAMAAILDHPPIPNFVDEA